MALEARIVDQGRAGVVADVSRHDVGLSGSAVRGGIGLDLLAVEMSKVVELVSSSVMRWMGEMDGK